MQVARVKRQQGLVNIVGPELGAGRFQQTGDAAVVVGVAVGDDDPRHVGHGGTEQGHAGLQQAEGSFSAGVNQRQSFVLKNIGPSWPGVGMSFLWHRYRMDTAS